MKITSTWTLDSRDPFKITLMDRITYPYRWCKWRVKTWFKPTMTCAHGYVSKIRAPDIRRNPPTMEDEVTSQIAESMAKCMDADVMFDLKINKLG